MTFSEVLSIGAMVLTLLGLVGGWFLIRPQTNSLDSSTAEKYQQIADKAAQTINSMQIRMDALEKEVNSLKKESQNANERASRFEDWAKRLVYQVRSMGGIPVDLDPTRPLGSQ